MVARSSRALIVFFLAAAFVPRALGADDGASSARQAAARQAAHELLADKVGRVIRLRTSSGGEFTGRLYRLLEDRIEIVNSEGQIVQVAAEEVASAVVVEQGTDGRSYFQDAAANRLIVMPTGFGMEPGEFHIAVQELVVVTASYGVSPHFSLWGGISIPGALVNARFSIPLGGSAAVSLGSFAGLSWFDFLAIAMPYAILSVGSPARNVTVGAAMPVLADFEQVRIGAVIAAIGGKIVLSRTAAIVTENWVMLGSDDGRWDGTPIYVIPTVVFRIAGSRFSWDVGATIPVEIDEGYGTPIAVRGFPFGDYLVPLPLISFTYRIK